MTRIRVEWDTSSDNGVEWTAAECGLPEIVDVPDYVCLCSVEEEYIDADGQISEDFQPVTDWLSDEYGFCVFGWEVIDDVEPDSEITN